MEISRTRIFEVSVRFSPRWYWEWQVTANGKLLARGFELDEKAAKLEGNKAMFRLLASGWK
jgi:hypothetical protein